MELQKAQKVNMVYRKYQGSCSEQIIANVYNINPVASTAYGIVSFSGEELVVHQVREDEWDQSCFSLDWFNTRFTK